MHRIAAALIAMAAILPGPAAQANAQTQARKLPYVAAGRIVDLGEFRSEHADPRRVVVWLPSTYRTGGPRHAVLYMHDGQNLFDKKTAGYGMEWEIDETLEPDPREEGAADNRGRHLEHAQAAA